MSEISDLIWFIAEWCTANDYKLEDVAQYNIDKLKKNAIQMVLALKKKAKGV